MTLDTCRASLSRAGACPAGTTQYSASRCCFPSAAAGCCKPAEVCGASCCKRPRMCFGGQCILLNVPPPPNPNAPAAPTPAPLPSSTYSTGAPVTPVATYTTTSGQTIVTLQSASGATCNCLSGQSCLDSGQCW